MTELQRTVFLQSSTEGQEKLILDTFRRLDLWKLEAYSKLLDLEELEHRETGRSLFTVRSAREHAGLSVGDAAAKLGVKVSTLQNWECGRVLPRIETIMRICNLYDISPDNVAWNKRDNTNLVDLTSRIQAATE